MVTEFPNTNLWELAWTFPKLRGDRLKTLAACFARHGDRFQLNLPGAEPTYFINRPDDIKHVLVGNQSNYFKTGAYEQGKDLFGNGLLSSNGEYHLRQRKTLQPAFIQKKIATYGELMSSETERLLARWQPGTEIDLVREMMRLTVGIVGRALFGTDLTRYTAEINEAFTLAQRHVAFLDSLWFELPESFIRRRVERYRAAVGKLRQLVDGMIAEARQRNPQPDDVFNILFHATESDGAPLPEKQIQDETLTIMLAGHETTANVISWAFVRLAKQPEIEDRLLAEIRSVLGDRPPTIEDVPKLVYTEMVFAEALRLYPPVWIMGRRAQAEDVLPSGVRVPAKMAVAMLPYLVHRNPEYFPDPERFDPERFTAANRASRPQFAYFPFGGGARVCIGEAFARIESVMILARILQQWRLKPSPGQTFKAEPLLTYRIRNGFRVVPERRA
jgi:cytochrome P450